MLTLHNGGGANSKICCVEIVTTGGASVSAPAASRTYTRATALWAADRTARAYVAGERAELRIFDLHGRTVMVHSVQAGAARAVSINMLASGSYIARLISPRGEALAECRMVLIAK